MRPDFTCAPLGNESRLLFHSLHLVIKREVWKLIYRALFYIMGFIGLSHLDAIRGAIEERSKSY